MNQSLFSPVECPQYIKDSITQVLANRNDDGAEIIIPRCFGLSLLEECMTL